MTIEEEFFKEFGLKPYYLYYVFDLQGRKNNYCFKKEEFINFVKKNKKYLLLKVEKKTPEITDRKLLELICILDNFTVQNYLSKQPFDIFELKQSVLRRCLYLDDIGINKDELRQQIKALFERV